MNYVMDEEDAMAELEARVADQEKLINKLRIITNDLAGVMHNPENPPPIERLVWRYIEGESHGHPPETWFDYAHELEKKVRGYEVALEQIAEGHRNEETMQDIATHALEENE